MRWVVGILWGLAPRLRSDRLAVQGDAARGCPLRLHHRPLVWCRFGRVEAYQSSDSGAGAGGQRSPPEASGAQPRLGGTQDCGQGACGQVFRCVGHCCSTPCVYFVVPLSEFPSVTVSPLLFPTALNKQPDEFAPRYGGHGVYEPTLEEEAVATGAAKTIVSPLSS